MDTELKETLGEQSLKEMDFAIMKELADRLSEVERQRDGLLIGIDAVIATLSYDVPRLQAQGKKALKQLLRLRAGWR